MRGRDCEARLELALIALPGVTAVYASAEKERVVVIGLRRDIRHGDLMGSIEELGYRCPARIHRQQLIAIRRWLTGLSAGLLRAIRWSVR